MTKIKFLKQKHQNKISITQKKLSLVQEQGTTFPMKIGTSICNALIDTGATKVVLVKNIISTYP